MLWTNIFRAVILTAALLAIAFGCGFHMAFKQQRNEIETMSDQQKAVAEINNNKFKSQADQIDILSRNLDDAQQRIKDQGDAFEQKNESKRMSRLP